MARGGVRLIVFDFDQTLSVVHVFKSLAGWSEKGCPQHGILKVPRPFASSELGQARRIDELNKSDTYGRAGFSRTVFGGDRRINDLEHFFKALKGHGVELMICTKGLVGAVKKILTDLGLLEFFSEVYGNVGSEAYGSTAYDKASAKTQPSAQEQSFLGSNMQGAWRTKADLIARLLSQRKMQPHHGLLVEDDPEEVRKASNTCRTFLVREAEGLQPEELAQILRMTDFPEATVARRNSPSPTNETNVGPTRGQRRRSASESPNNSRPSSRELIAGGAAALSHQQHRSTPPPLPPPVGAPMGPTSSARLQSGSMGYRGGSLGPPKGPSSAAQLGARSASTSYSPSNAHRLPPGPLDLGGKRPPIALPRRNHVRESSKDTSGVSLQMLTPKKPPLGPKSLVARDREVAGQQVHVGRVLQ
mmetsp:Transcript_66605/g.139046  ORF Transcript_66605/g.139046 Transcript_66605/m.139046 type:complete len:418 (+) Transcript_66605:68-1321(+)